uniref:Uncharacterized protein n=1 Tax=Physcomitrium patens TaxID=3218 RepID=A0A2K1IGZ2_PHYPA|nr:hypothetical protein PHYPA_029132 [Physcomitrium patens]
MLGVAEGQNEASPVQLSSSELKRGTADVKKAKNLIERELVATVTNTGQHTKTQSTVLTLPESLPLL